MIKLKLFKQSEGYCGPASLKMILSVYGINKSENYLAKIGKTTRTKGTKQENIVKAAKKIGFKNSYLKKKSTIKELRSLIEKGLPIIVAWTSPEEGGHYSVAVDLNNHYITLADPHFGELKKHTIKWFDYRWKEKNKKTLITEREIIVVKK